MRSFTLWSFSTRALAALVLPVRGEYLVVELGCFLPRTLLLAAKIQSLLFIDDELLELGEVLPLQLRQALLVAGQVVLDLKQRLAAVHESLWLSILRQGHVRRWACVGAAGGMRGALPRPLAKPAHLELREAAGPDAEAVRGRRLVGRQVR